MTSPSTHRAATEQTCSGAARARRDPLVGSAPTQERYLLVEVDGGWGPKGFPDTSLPEDVKDEVLAAAEAAGAKVMLIRRPGRQASSVCLMRAWCVADLRTGQVTWGTYAYPTELLEASDLLSGMPQPGSEEPLPRVRAGSGETGSGWAGSGEAGAGGADSREADAGAGSAAGSGRTAPGLLLVCTHGRKDVCCATRGRPVAAVLARRWPEQTWECSHTGGDRFAANLLMLPDGVAYGGLDEGEAVALVEEHLAGRPSLEHLRGALGLTRPEQGAVLAAHRELGPVAWGEVTVTGTTSLPAGPSAAEAASHQPAAGPDAAQPATEPDAAQPATEPDAAQPATEPDGSAEPRTRVQLALADGRRATVDVVERPRPKAPLTCGGADKVSIVPETGPVTLL